MSLITQFRGPVKSGKTLSAVYWTKRLAARIGCPVYTNMKECWIRDPENPYQGSYWAQTVKLDDLIEDMMIHDLDHARFKLAILLWDEAHIYWDHNNMKGLPGQVLTAFIAQAGKRGMPIVYTAHLRKMVAPRVRDLTELSVKCKTDNFGRTVLWNVRDEKAFAEAMDENEPPPDDVWHVLHDGQKQFLWYDTNEVISPFDAGESVLASKRWKQAINAIHKRGEPEPVKEDERRALVSEVGAASAELIEESQAKKPGPLPMPGRKGPKNPRGGKFSLAGVR